MKNNSHTYTRSIAGGLGVLLLVFATAACDSSSGVQSTGGGGDVDESIALLAADLGISGDELAAISGSVDGSAAAFGGAQDPGFLWEMAAALQSSLSEEQKAKLFERLEQFESRGGPGAMGQGQFGQGPGGQGFRQGPGGQGFRQGPGGQGFRQGPGGQGLRQGPGGQGLRQGPGGQGLRQGPGGHMHGGQGVRQGFAGRAQAALGRLELTDDQKDAIRAIHESYRDEFQAILDQRGTLDRDEITARFDELHDAIRAEVEAVLTADQIRQLEEMKAQAEARREERRAEAEQRREEARAVMADVLGLTDAQLDELETLRDGRADLHDAVRDMIDAGADREDVQAYLDDQRAAHQAAIMSIVDDRQYEIMQIHRFLSMRFAAHRMHPSMHSTR